MMKLHRNEDQNDEDECVKSIKSWSDNAEARLIKSKMVLNCIQKHIKFHLEFTFKFSDLCNVNCNKIFLCNPDVYDK